MNNARVYDLVNDDGRPFAAVFNLDRDTVDFYDNYDDRYPYPGQFTGARYYVDTFLGHRGVLHLHGGVPEWVLSEFNVLDVKAWLYTL